MILKPNLLLPTQNNIDPNSCIQFEELMNSFLLTFQFRPGRSLGEENQHYQLSHFQ